MKSFVIGIVVLVFCSVLDATTLVLYCYYWLYFEISTFFEVVMNKEKRERQANFSSSEEKLLVELVLKYGSVIENKETDSDVWKKKAETWELIDRSMVVSSGK